MVLIKMILTQRVGHVVGQGRTIVIGVLHGAGAVEV